MSALLFQFSLSVHSVLLTTYNVPIQLDGNFEIQVIWGTFKKKKRKVIWGENVCSTFFTNKEYFYLLKFIKIHEINRDPLHNKWVHIILWIL